MIKDSNPCALTVVLSGNGSNLQAILDQRANQGYQVVHVISNNPEAFGLERARRAGIDCSVVNHRDFGCRAEFDEALAAAIDRHKPQGIVLAGFMRILGEQFVQRYQGRLFNIHPSLLPKFRGMDTHRRALAAGDTEHGASVHFVTPELDGGPVIAQGIVPIGATDDEESLRSKVAELEHRLYPEVLGWFARGRLRLDGDLARLDGEALTKAPVVS